MAVGLKTFIAAGGLGSQGPPADNQNLLCHVTNLAAKEIKGTSAAPCHDLPFPNIQEIRKVRQAADENETPKNGRASRGGSHPPASARVRRRKEPLPGFMGEMF